MPVDAVSSSSNLPPVQAAKPVQSSARDGDGDHDNGAAESAAAKARQAANANDPLPTDPAKGRNVNVTA